MISKEEARKKIETSLRQTMKAFMVAYMVEQKKFVGIPAPEVASIVLSMAHLALLGDQKAATQFHIDNGQLSCELVMDEIEKKMKAFTG